MIDLVVELRTALSPEWDRWFDEQFTDLIAGDEELLRSEFDDLISSGWSEPPPPHSPSAPPGTEPPEPGPPRNGAGSPLDPGPADQPSTRPPPHA